MKRQRISAVCGLAMAAAAWSPPADAAKNDVDQDGRSDLLLQRVALHECARDEDPSFTHNNAHVVWGVRPGPTNLGFERLQGVDSDAWRAAASGDFDGDGLPDLYWERMSVGEGDAFHDSVRVDVKAAFTRSEPVVFQTPEDSPGDGAPPASWRVVGSGDFVGGDSTEAMKTPPDGRDDLVWQDQSTGEMALWVADGVGFPKHLRFQLPAPALDERVVAVGDLDGDARQEIVFADADGGLLYWSMDGVTAGASGEIEPKQPANVNWQVGGAGDFNRDGADDLVLINRTMYRIAVWYMDDRVTGRRLDGGWAELTGDGAPDPDLRCSEWRIAGPR
jgi:hypothetical protein